MRWLIDGWMNEGSRVLTYAQFKAGKTTLISNLMRSIADGDPFLGEAAVTPMNQGETVVLLDFEMFSRQLKDWTKVQNIQNTQSVVVKPLRGEAQSFNILDSRCRAEWARDLRSVNCKFLIVDCIGPVMSALDLDESSNTQVGRFLRLVDELLVAARVPNCWLVQHMGHDEKRPRGASTQLGWCDVSIKLMCTNDPSTGQRSISAVGRGVSQKKRDLLYDAKTHRFTIVPVGQLSFTVGAAPPKLKAVDDALREIVLLLQSATTPQSVQMLHQLLAGKGVLGPKGVPFHDNTIRDACKTGVATGALKKSGNPQRPEYSLP